VPDPEAVAVLLAVFCAAVVNGMSGFGFMLVLVPALSLAVGPVNGVIIANLVSPFQGVVMFLLLRRYVVWSTLTVLLVAGAVGTPVGMIALLALPTETIRLVIAISVLAGAAAIWRGLRISHRGRAAESAVGFLSGTLKTGAGINGPPVVLYLQGARMEPLPFRATLSAFFLLSNLMAVVAVAGSGELTGPRIATALVAVPFLVAGALAGNRLFQFIDAGFFRKLVLGLLVAGSIAVLVSAVAI